MKDWPAYARVAGGSEGALVMVGHSECETSRLMLGALERLHRRRTRDVPVTAVLQDEPEDARRLAEELGLTLAVLADGAPHPLTAPLGLGGVPVTFLVGPDGEVEESLEGFRRADVERLGARLGVPPPVFGPDERVPALRPG